jgi:spore maturation protein CgeB
MRIVLFCHSLVSDWNHGNAHFLRGVVSELGRRGHDVLVYEPKDGWSAENLRRDHGERALLAYRAVYPHLRSETYSLDQLRLDEMLADAHLVLVHEWSDTELVRRVGEHRKKVGDYLLLFHDTHHRMVTQPAEMNRFDLRHYDGVLAFGEVLRKLYQQRGITSAAFTWHEAADLHVFTPLRALDDEPRGELVWIGNWGDDERTQELEEYLLGPVRKLGIRTTVHGVRYPEQALQALAKAGAIYRGFLPNHRVPWVFAHHTCTVHVPRGPYVRDLPGIPTIRVFEALACGIPLLSAPWCDEEGLFEPGRDFLTAREGGQMERLLRMLLHEPSLRAELIAHGLGTIRSRHSCAHRVDELLAICATLGLSPAVGDTARAHPSPGALPCPSA